MTVRAYLALGSNMGDRADNLRQAVEKLHGREGISVVRISPVYETAPVGFVDQEAFLNMAVAVETDLTPEKLLESALAVEQELGRVRTIRWGPRTIDIDVLLYGDTALDQEHLTIPHPAMTERAFVLVPLRDVLEGGLLPVFNRPLDDFLRLLPQDDKGVQKWGTIVWETGSGHSAN
ncbi:MULTISPECIES: 2-amino-4-hydroxy-6-hydroxymethyldihydropteridine diphosphokinase [Brevibacillus]|jgi:2-amino-4-hydroxy-6-hydroxymethyldihydropteridine diphosphokinase|uniref:2-amino-4-hydroxy-6-hydroxymethyldihydropteridine diphosphokinase n=1 Tax=Brevibacillus borstelensis AK1 TaxID=1300222 RepID=M8DCK2_9BACL|nr:2-amino-4-hydroxy-6-hydroxymethyldihydropteridine diphosphokinase [Brevibacillus borstelensis]EMT51153.1 2-amino-4-hydroxy-6- hydroxymethyldihydropteridine pyrophosphokinase [Brevibacillus borstelensis AK1]MBE5394137.1 2-amino-4-hydroxy-6-hydroxymethyldihydropteridine diphosphokinase [Brevibacillus borstelensis]MCC0566045.1 2-amino-4-hydroxy-6-hydroxymethyldihydropteridine diphosphokinase [Brevibacillus borstelensis]MCM3472747.1 2-amino-4-hydroxy-6-hydroxymethyldihydropteridine diphosphokina